ncbi:MAG TPA: diguanylate cyclase [Thermoleophilaceae bacterium]|nr:diguanylate cyclase [Thermoleophilaceae bacterium]
MRLSPVLDRKGEDHPFGAEEMARTLAFLFVSGGSLCLVTAALDPRPETNVAGVVATALAALVVGGILLWRGDRLSVEAVAAFLAVGTGAITTVVYFDGPDSIYAVYYLWAGAEAFLFLSTRGIALQMGLIGVAYAWVLGTGPGATVPFGTWAVVLGAALALGVLVGYLRLRLIRLLDRLTAVARTDELTGIPNRRAFQERFDQELARAARDAQPLSVLVGDLDGFKLVNDRQGHPEGDAALRRVAGELERWKRATDVAARVGGEEFALLLPATAHDEAEQVAERLRLGIREVFAGDEVPLSISFGIATFPVHAPDGPGVLRAADQALYSAKEKGRDRSVVFSEEASESLEGARQRLADSSEMQLATVVGLAEALDIRDTGTGEHSRTVARYAGLMARRMGFAGQRVERIELAGLLHDVGKIGISDTVLTKPGPLNEEEWLQMRTHPQIGARLLGRPELADLRSWIVAHHERPDGKGYPFGLSGAEIPMEARILSVADAYEAMTANRVYKRAMAREAARQELMACAGAQFDAEVVDVFLQAMEEESSEEVLVQGS